MSLDLTLHITERTLIRILPYLPDEPTTAEVLRAMREHVCEPEATPDAPAEPRTAEGRHDLAEALTRELAYCVAPVPTSVIAQRLQRRNPSLALDVDGIARALLRMAPTHPHATHNGDTKMRFGRHVTGWLWHDVPQREGSVPLLVPGPKVTAPPPVVETVEWDALPVARDVGACHECGGTAKRADGSCVVCWAATMNARTKL